MAVWVIGALALVLVGVAGLMILDPGRVPLEDFIFTLKDVAANDLLTVRTNPGTWSTQEINGISYVILNDSSLELFRAARDGKLQEFLLNHPEFLGSV